MRVRILPPLPLKRPISLRNRSFSLHFEKIFLISIEGRIRGETERADIRIFDSDRGKTPILDIFRMRFHTVYLALANTLDLTSAAFALASAI